MAITKTDVLTIGTFDLFHAGHVELLQECRKLAGPSGFVYVGVNTDEFVKRFKGVTTSYNLDERLYILRAIKYVDFVGINDGDEDAWPMIQKVKPDIIAIGDDWRDRDYLAQLHVTEQQLKSVGAVVNYIPRTTGQSSSRIRETLRG